MMSRGTGTSQDVKKDGQTDIRAAMIMYTRTYRTPADVAMVSVESEELAGCGGSGSDSLPNEQTVEFGTDGRPRANLDHQAIVCSKINTGHVSAMSGAKCGTVIDQSASAPGRIRLVGGHLTKNKKNNHASRTSSSHVFRFLHPVSCAKHGEVPPKSQLETHLDVDPRFVLTLSLDVAVTISPGPADPAAATDSEQSVAPPSPSPMASKSFTIQSLIDLDKPEGHRHKTAQPKPLHPSLMYVQLKLEMQDLWNQFNRLSTEMIVTKSGRRMFPTIQVSASGMEAKTLYNLMVDFVSLESKRYRYSYHQSAWVVAGPSDPELPPRVHLHQDSAAVGTHWMRQVINFDKLKITNNQMDTNGYIVLNSMHRYQPRVHVGLANFGVEDDAYQTMKTFIFPETAFMAVTAYQNQRITNLKIASNPFAKGFRDMESDDWFFSSISNYIVPGKSTLTAAFEPQPIFTLPPNPAATAAVYLPTAWPIFFDSSAFFPQFLMRTHFDK